MRCWQCRSKLHHDWVFRDGLLRGRDESEGGPYRIYPCPSCRRENRIESIGEGKFYASPARDLGLVDWLVSWIEPLAPDDFLQLQEWQQKFGEERRLVFERAGLKTYSGTRWRQWVSRRPAVESGSETESNMREKQTHSAETQKDNASPTQLPLHHPLQILGLDRDSTPQQIRSRFRALVKQYHPDKHGSLDRSQIDQASKKLKSLIEAYEKLEKDGKV